MAEQHKSITAGVSFVARTGERHDIINLSPTPLDKAHSLKLRSGIPEWFSFSGLKHSLKGVSQAIYSFVKVGTVFSSSERTSRIMAALGLSFVLVFLIFFVALQLQRAVILRAFEEAEKDAPRISSLPSDAAVAN